MRRKIKWEYWQNPFDGDKPEYVPEDEAEIPSPWEADNEDEDLPPHRIRPVIPTPMGFLPVNPYREFNRAFEWWMGYTNFDVTADARNKIEAVPGVEVLEILMRYTFRIAVGKCFQSPEVKLEIQRVLDAMPPQKGEMNPGNMSLDEDTRQKVSVLKKSLGEKFPFWAVYVLPNGEIDVGGSSTEDGYERYVDLYRETQKLVGGVIYQHA
jgi:hypothetical protein